jgi:hypothetical protein
MYPGRADMLCPTVIGRFGPESDMSQKADCRNLLIHLLNRSLDLLHGDLDSRIAVPDFASFILDSRDRVWSGW